MHHVTVHGFPVTPDGGNHTIDPRGAHREQLLELAAGEEVRDVRVGRDPLEPHVRVDSRCRGVEGVHEPRPIDLAIIALHSRKKVQIICILFAYYV